MSEHAQIMDDSGSEFPGLRGMRYLRFLKRLHAALEPEWYLEIGSYTGASLQHATCKTIAVDPAFRIRKEIVGSKPALHCLAMTSDAFFESGVAEALGARFDLAFLDGMHQFEFLLRDFIGAERLSAEGGTIVLHDCVPVSYVGAEREWDTEATKAWTGDVWKVIPILRRYRPDLTIRTVDCPPSGLVMVTGLDPASRVLEEAYDEIIAAFTEARLSPSMLRDLTRDLALEPARRYLANLAPVPVSEPADIAIKIPAPRESTARQWGEYHFGRSLAKAFERTGLSARVDCHEDWDTARHPGELDLLLRGIRPASAVTNRQAVWVLSHGESVAEDECSAAERVFVASDLDERLRPSTPLLHCTDPEMFFPREPVPGCMHDTLFVGACYPKRRASGMVAWAVEAGLPLSVIGSKWDWLPDGAWVRRHIRNSKLGDFYASAKVVLNDHPPEMRIRGYVNNRVFDVLACGTPLVSDPVAGLPDGFDEFIYFADTPESIRDAVAEARSESAPMQTRRREFSEYVREYHSFDARVAVLVDALGLRSDAPEIAEVLQHA